MTEPGGEGQSAWSCEFTSQTQKWTVGAKQVLVCSGEPLEMPLREVQILFKNEKEDAYKLYVLRVMHSELNQIQLEVTSYRPGVHQNKVFYLKGQNQKVVVKPLSWSVESVLSKTQKPVPYFSLGPFELKYPWWFWGNFVILGTAILLWLILVVRRRIERNNLIADLRKHNTALGPYGQFNKDLRQLKRKCFSHPESYQVSQEELKGCLDGLEELFKMYLLRAFLVPAHKWPASQVLKDIKKHHKKVFMHAQMEIKSLFKEFKRSRGKLSLLKMKDCEQLLRMTQKCVALCEKYRKQEGAQK
ncbi:MAG: hypothetical protein D6797_05285 [Bdellovibrio sp.]|nr:MAG: hypothetical protein D6797_05285 [Bdellovibrio sp.]